MPSSILLIKPTDSYSTINANTNENPSPNTNPNPKHNQAKVILT